MKIIAHAARIAGTLAVLAIAIASGAPAAAQGQARKPVVVALPDSFPETHEPRGQITGVRGMVVRFASPGKRDMVILKHDDASPETLAAAINLLRRFRREVPNPQSDRVATLVDFVPPKLTPAAREALAARLRELNSQQASRVGNLGSGRWIEIPDAILNP